MIKEKALVALFVFAVSLNAVTGKEKIVITMSGADSPHKIEITGSTRITFDSASGKMLVGSPDSPIPVEFDINDIERITFDMTTSSAESIATDLDGVSIVNNHGVVTITAAEGTVTYAAWNSKGLSVAAGTSADPVVLDFTAMPGEVYIVKANYKILKFVNK